MTIARSSLLDFFDNQSWIKKSNFEGIFNLMIFCLFLMLICLPMANYSLYGRVIDPKFLYLVLRNAPGLVLKWAFLEIYSSIALLVQMLILGQKKEGEAGAQFILKIVQYFYEAMLLLVIHNLVWTDKGEAIDHFADKALGLDAFWDKFITIELKG